MHPADIKAAIEKAGTSQAALAKRLGLTPMAVWQVIHGRSHSRRVATAIAKAISKPISEIWPGVYTNRAA